jgi:hypothetical protein
MALNCRHGDARKEGVIFWYAAGTETPEVPKFGKDLGIAHTTLPNRCRFCEENEA